MDKPFDTKVLVDKLKAKGLNVAEDLAEVVAGEVLDWAEESCAAHSSAFVKLGAPVISAIKPIVLKQLDKIDNEVG